MLSQELTNRSSTLSQSFGTGIKAAVIGASGGIGGALVDTLCDLPAISHVYALSRSSTQFGNSKVSSLAIDIEKENTITAAAQDISARTATIDILIVASGLLHKSGQMKPERSLKELDSKFLSAAFGVNTIGPLLIAKHFHLLLPKTKKSLFGVLSARVGSIEDNCLGGWYSYRISKAGLNMGIKTLSLELARLRPQAACVGLHPGTVETNLSRPFIGKTNKRPVFSPHAASKRLLQVVSNLSHKDSGLVFDWSGKRIPY